MEINEIAGNVVNSAFEVHTTLGPGLLEDVYKRCLKAELLARGLQVIAEVGLPVLYKQTSADLGYRIDLLVEDIVTVELKAVQQLSTNHRAQIYTYL